MKLDLRRPEAGIFLDEDGLLNVEVGGVELLEDQPFGHPSSSTNLLQLRLEEAWKGIWLECIF